MKSMIFGLLASGLTLSPAMATTADLCKDGTPAIVRISTIKATGSRAGFDKAVQDQIAWYRSNGQMDNKIVVAEVVDVSGSTPMLSTTEVMTVHYNPPSLTDAKPAPAALAGYRAFVAEFGANSTIVTDKIVCLPK